MELKGTALENPYPPDEIRPRRSSNLMFTHYLIGNIRSRNASVMDMIDQVYTASQEKGFEITDTEPQEINIIFGVIDAVIKGKIK